MRLDLVCDVSGSMVEGGRPYALRTAVLTAAQLVRLGYMRAELSLWGWAAAMRPFPDWAAGDEFPPDLMSCSGNTSGQALLQWAEQTPPRHVVLFTDGYFLSSATTLLNQLRRQLPNGALRFIKLGADCNPHLKGTDVFSNEDMFAAFDDWMEPRSP